jgi:hypothetical protein
MEQAAPAPAPEAQGCEAATEAEALGLRGAALNLVLMGVVQAVLAAAADVAVAGSLVRLGRCLAALAHLIGAINVGFLCYVVSRAAVVTMGNCAVNLVFDYVLVRQLGLYSLASRRFDQPVCLDKIATVG